jgi:hypothetical protein
MPVCFSFEYFAEKENTKYNYYYSHLGIFGFPSSSLSGVINRIDVNVKKWRIKFLFQALFARLFVVVSLFSC